MRWEIRTGLWRWILRLSVIAVLGAFSRDAYALSGELAVIRGVDAAMNSQGMRLIIHLETPVRYRAHTQDAAAKALQIQLDPIDSSSPLNGMTDSGMVRQVYPWNGSGMVPLIEIIYEQDRVGGINLVLHFKSALEVQVERLEGGRDVVVLLPNTSGEKASPVNAEAAKAFGEGKQALASGDYATAVRMFTKVLSYPENDFSRDSKELLGLARQRRGQLAHAKAEYEEYLEKYPGSEGAVRVRQRLDTLETAASSPREAVEGSRATLDRQTENSSHAFGDWRARGSLSQWYWLVRSDTDSMGSRTVDSLLDTDLFMSADSEGDRYRMRTYFSGDYRHDLEAGSSGDSNEFRASDAVAEFSDLGAGWLARVGRQSQYAGGVLGRFDGVLLGYELSPGWTVKTRAGFPVDFSVSNGINSDAPFYGLSLEATSIAEHWDGELYFIHNTLDGIENRSAVGMEIRYANHGFSLSSLVDYDVSYSTINSGLLLGGLSFGGGAYLHLRLDYRKSPFLTTRNALIGHPDESLDDLVDQLGENTVRNLAEDRTTDLKSGGLALSVPLSQAWILGSDVSVFDLSSTPASGGVMGTPGTGAIYDVGMFLTRLDWLVERSSSTVGLRYQGGNNQDRVMLDLNGRYLLLDRLRLGPRVRFERRTFDQGTEFYVIRPSLRFDYQLGRSFSMELDLGSEWRIMQNDSIGEDATQYFLTTGVRYDF